MSDTPDDDHDREPELAPAPLSVRQIVGSTLAAAFGVQSRANRERDFTRGRIVHFVIAGIVFTVVFVLVLVTVVNLVI